MLQGRIASAINLLKDGLRLLLEWENRATSTGQDSLSIVQATRSFFVRFSQQALWVSICIAVVTHCLKDGAKICLC